MKIFKKEIAEEGKTIIVTKVLTFKDENTIDTLMTITNYKDDFENPRIEYSNKIFMAADEVLKALHSAGFKEQLEG